LKRQHKNHSVINSINKTTAMAKEEPKSAKNEDKITLVSFCDIYGVNDVDRNAVFMKYGKLTENSTEDWVMELKSKITLKSDK